MRKQRGHQINSSRSRQKTFRNNKRGFRGKYDQQRYRREGKEGFHSRGQHIKAAIDRTQVCPFFTRVFYCVNGFNHYQSLQQLPTERQIKLYLWMNSSLKEITQLLRAYLQDIRTKQRFTFHRISQENGKLVKQLIGTVIVHKKALDNQETILQDVNYSIGDIIDVSISYK